MVSSFSIVGSIIFLFELTHCDLRFDQVKEAMDDLGYYVAGMVCNTSNYGLPQQRQRAWLMCVLKSQSSRSATDQMCQALGLFQCEPIPLEKIISKKTAFSAPNGKTFSCQTIRCQVETHNQRSVQAVWQGHVFWERRGWAWKNLTVSRCQ